MKPKEPLAWHGTLDVVFDGIPYQLYASVKYEDEGRDIQLHPGRLRLNGVELSIEASVLLSRQHIDYLSNLMLQTAAEALGLPPPPCALALSSLKKEESRWRKDEPEVKPS